MILCFVFSALFDPPLKCQVTVETPISFVLETDVRGRTQVSKTEKVIWLVHYYFKEDLTTRIWRNVSVTYCADKTILKCIMQEKNMKTNVFLADQVYSTSRFVCHDLEPLVKVREPEIFILISEIVFFTLGSLFTEPSIFGAYEYLH